MSANKSAELRRDNAKSAEKSKAGEKPRRKSGSGAPNDVSRALRTAYDDALSEQVPDEFLDLLGKLS